MKTIFKSKDELQNMDHEFESVGELNYFMEVNDLVIIRLVEEKTEDTTIIHVQFN